MRIKPVVNGGGGRTTKVLRSKPVCCSSQPFSKRMWGTSATTRSVFSVLLLKIRVLRAILNVPTRCSTVRREYNLSGNTAVRTDRMEDFRSARVVCSMRWRGLCMPFVIHFFNGVVFCLGGHRNMGSHITRGFGGFTGNMHATFNAFTPPDSEGARDLNAGRFLYPYTEKPIQANRGSSPVLQGQTQGVLTTNIYSPEGIVREHPLPEWRWPASVSSSLGDSRQEHANSLVGSDVLALLGEREQQQAAQRPAAEGISTRSRDPLDKKESPSGTLRNHRSKRKTTKANTTRTTSLVYDQPILRPALPSIKGVKRSLIGCLVSGLTGGAFPAVAIAVWGMVELLMSMNARATIRGLDPTFTMSMRNWIEKQEESRKAKAAGKSA